MSKYKSDYTEDRIQAEKYVRSVEKDLQTERIDPDTYQGKKKLEELFKGYSESSVKVLREVFKEQNLPLMGATAPYIRKRFQAVLQTLPEARRRFAEAFPRLCIEHEFVKITGTFGTLTYNTLDMLKRIHLAAALWMLDELERQGKLSEAIKLLPSAVDTQDVELPRFFRDASYDNGLVRGMICLIRSRNDTEFDFEPDYRPFVDENILKRSERTWTYGAGNTAGDGPSPCRETFDRIMGMLNPLRIERAVRRFEEKAWEVFGQCLAVTDGIRKKEIENLEETLELARKDLELVALLEKTDIELNAALTRAKSKPLPKKNNLLLTRQPTLEELVADPYEDPDVIRLENKIKSLEDQRDAPYDAIAKKEAERDANRLLFSVVPPYICFGPVPDADVQSSDPDMPDLSSITGITVTDPFEACFALLYMLDSGNPVAWLVPLCAIVANAACKLLPWFYSSALEFENPQDDPGDTGRTDAPDGTETDTESPESDESEYVPPDLTEWNEKLYERKYRNPDATEEKSRKRNPNKLLNFPQYIYALTDTAIPRVLYPDDNTDEYRAAGFSKQESLLLDRYVSLADGSISRDYYFSTRSVGAKEESDPSESDAASAGPSVPEPQQQPDADEIRALKNEKKDLLRKMEALESDKAKLETEVAELRTLIRTGADANRRKNSGIPEVIFPYAAEGRYVVFGGHDSWLRAIRPLLDNVRFVGPNTRPDIGLILNADAVWLQTNAISHAYFYKIINIIRTHGVPVRYFSFASAEKCAEELAIADMGYGDTPSPDEQ